MDYVIERYQRLDCSQKVQPSFNCFCFTASCRKFNHRQCAARLDYKRSYFPNAMVKTHRKGKREYRIVRRIANCHEMFLTATCSMIFPQCTAGTTTVARICKSLCYEIEESCRGDFENLEIGDWPVECEMYSDENPDGEGFCDGPEGGGSTKVKVLGSRFF